jgi:hypothetical protein
MGSAKCELLLWCWCYVLLSSFPCVCDCYRDFISISKLFFALVLLFYVDLILDMRIWLFDRYICFGWFWCICLCIFRFQLHMHGQRDK